MDDSGGFKKKRQNVIGISLVILLFHFLKVQTPDKLDVFNIEIPIVKPEYFTLTIWVLFVYLVYRFYVEWIYSEKREYDKYMNQIVWTPIKDKVYDELMGNPEFIKHKSRIHGSLHKFLTNPLTRYYSRFILDQQNPNSKVEVVLFRSIFSKYVWKTYYKVKILGQFKRKYFSELFLPISLVLLVMFYVLIPEIIGWLFS